MRYCSVCLFVQVDEELEIKAYYAGHVLGAAMFQIKVGCESVVYTVSTHINIYRYLHLLLVVCPVTLRILMDFSSSIRVIIT